MAGRNHMPRRPDNYRSFRHGPRPVLSQRSGPLHIHPAILEEELEMQYREMQQIISENRLVVDDNTHLQRELATAKDDIHQLEQVIPRLQAEKEVHARELIERGLKLEAELRASVPLNEEVVQLRTEVQHLTSLRQELTSQVKGFTQDVTHLETENKQLTTMRSDIEALHEDLVEARRAFEYERKANEEQFEQKQAMEKNLVSMAREIEKLRAEKLNAERRDRGGGSYMLNGSPEMRYGGVTLGDGSGGRWTPYDKHVRHGR